MSNIPIVRLVLAFMILIEFWFRGSTDVVYYLGWVLLFITTINFFASQHQINRMLGRK